MKLNVALSFLLWIFTVVPASAQWDDRAFALYGEKVRPLKYVVTNFSLKGDPLTKTPIELRRLEERLEGVVHQIAKRLSKPEYNIEVLKDYPSMPLEDRASIMVFGIQLIIKDGKKLDIPTPHFIATVNPVFGRMLICLGYPYYDYETPDLFIVPEDEQAFVKEFEKVVQPMITRGFRRIVCRNPKNKRQSLCEAPKRKYDAPLK
jgi:hypothetical protein